MNSIASLSTLKASRAANSALFLLSSRPFSLNCNHLLLKRTVASSTTTPTDYKYTLPNRLLTVKQRQSYEKDGFLVFCRLIEPAKLDAFKRRFQTICSQKLRIPGMTVMKDVSIAKSEFLEGESAITKVQDFCYDDELFAYCCLPEIVELVKCFTGPNMMAMHTMLINKPPDTGSQTSRHPLHQDLYYFPFRPANRIVCVWTAMEKITQANGCLVVVPGTHRGEFLQHAYPPWDKVNKMYYAIKDIDVTKVNLVPLEMEGITGDSVMFHPLLHHGSGTNRTYGYRKAISCHYAASECEYIETSGTIQEGFKHEVEALANKKFGLPKDQKVDIKDIWRLKSRLVNGERINL